MRPRIGFTLIEMLVVVAIIGILASVVQFAFSGGGNRQALTSISEATAQRIELARAQALQRNREWGVFVRQDGYQFLEFDPQAQIWQTVTDPVFKAVTLPADTMLELTSEGFDHKALKAQLSMAEPDDRSADADTSADQDRTLETGDRNELLPEILLLSSGEVTPFTLRFVPAGEGTPWIISSDGLQRVTASIEEPEE